MSAPITELFNAWQRGDEQAGAQLFQEVYPTLKTLVHGQLRKLGGVRSLQTTEYLSEVYLELERQHQSQTVSRSQFYAIVVIIVRRLVVNHYRAGQAQRRFGGQQQVSFEVLEQMPVADPDADYWLTLDRCIDELRVEDAAASQVVELRFMLGMSLEEIAATLQTSVSTISRSFRFARSWITRRLQPSDVLPST